MPINPQTGEEEVVATPEPMVDITLSVRASDVPLIREVVLDYFGEEYTTPERSMELTKLLLKELSQKQIKKYQIRKAKNEAITETVDII